MPEPRPAATIILLRDGARGLEVLLQRRGAGAAFMAGAHVFPGGVVDPRDREMPPSLVDDSALPRLAERVAALREAFEEAGILLATRASRPLDGTDLAAPDAIALRRRLHDRHDDADWRPWLAEGGLRLGVSSLALANRWVTPEAEPRRFDTWFFRAVCPLGQLAEHDSVEMVSSAWVRPSDALAAAARGEALVVTPTRRNLEDLVGFATAADAVADAHARGSDEPILPVLHRDGDRAWVTHPSFGRLDLR